MFLVKYIGNVIVFYVIYNMNEWMNAGCSTKGAIESLFRGALSRKSWKYNIRLLCRGNLNGNMITAWQNVTAWPDNGVTA